MADNDDGSSSTLVLLQPATFLVGIIINSIRSLHFISFATMLRDKVVLKSPRAEGQFDKIQWPPGHQKGNGYCNWVLNDSL